MTNSVIFAFGCLIAANAFGQPLQSADSVEILAFDFHNQKIIPCESILAFRSPEAKASEQATQFRGCVARRIPYGEYLVGLTTGIHKVENAGKCNVRAVNTVCVVSIASKNADYGDIPFHLKCARCGQEKDKIQFVVQSVFGDWRQILALPKEGSVAGYSPFFDLTVTVLVNGKPRGSHLLDLRSSTTFEMSILPGVNLGTKP